MRIRPSSDLDLGVLLGTLLGFTGSALLGALIEAHASREDFIFHYQTLLGSALAVTGAGLSVWVIRQQISQAGWEHDDNIQRRRKSARVVLPIALSSFTEYARECIHLLSSLQSSSTSSRYRGRRAVGFPILMPMIPKDVLADLKDNVEFGNEDASKAIAQMIRKFQVQNARLSGSIASANAKARITSDLIGNNVQYTYDAIDLHARCDILFDYARGNADYPSCDPELSHFLTAANICGRFEDNHPIFDMIKRRLKHEDS